jgi:hypothetical protein
MDSPNASGCGVGARLTNENGTDCLNGRLQELNKWILKYFVFIYFILATLIYAVLFVKNNHYTPLAGDGLGYYAYLPAIVIYKNPDLRKVYAINHSHPDWQQNIFPANIPGRYFDKFPMGVAHFTMHSQQVFQACFIVRLESFS